jgi:hypothetical protein
VIVTELDVHEARYFVVNVCVLVVLDTLDEGRSAVTYTNDGDADGRNSKLRQVCRDPSVARGPSTLTAPGLARC